MEMFILKIMLKFQQEQFVNKDVLDNCLIAGNPAYYYTK